MKSVTYDPQPLDQLEPIPGEARTDWLWDGLLARGLITLLVSQWKAGKTTLLAGLLRALEAGGTFLDRPCVAARAVIVSEEPVALWAVRRRCIPIGPHARLVSRPFPGRPTPEQWDELVRHAEAERAAGMIDLFVVDTLISFLPGRSDCNPGPVLDMLHPLRRLAASGAAILVLHHARREAAGEGNTARGSSSLLGVVDVILELSRLGSLAADECRRRITALSRYPETPRSLVYEWTPGTADFRAVPDVLMTRFRENWPTIEEMLATRTEPATHKELLLDWPPGSEPPSPSTLYEWLARAMKENRVVRTGGGTRNRPYRFELNWSERRVELPEELRSQVEKVRRFMETVRVGGSQNDNARPPDPTVPARSEVV